MILYPVGAVAPAARHSNPITEELSEASLQSIISQKESLSRVLLRWRELAAEQREARTRGILHLMWSFCSDGDGQQRQQGVSQNLFFCFYDQRRIQIWSHVRSIEWLVSW